jgi:prefoldin alpha subunit
MEKETKTQAEQQLQQKYLQLQMLQQQIEQYSQQLEMMAQQFAELELSQDALKQLEKTPKDNEILANIAPGIFFKASVKENKKLIINIGANTTAEKTVPQVIEMLEKQKKQMETNITQTDAAIQQLSQQAMGLYQELEKK